MNIDERKQRHEEQPKAFFLLKPGTAVLAQRVSATKSSLVWQIPGSASRRRELLQRLLGPLPPDSEHNSSIHLPGL
jgi:hypothetical protein